MQLLLVNFQILFYIKITNCFTDIKLMEQFIMKNSIKHANIIGCFRKKEQIRLAKSFITEKTFNMNVNNFKSIKDDLMFKADRIPTGILVDGDCPNMSEFLVKCALWKLFDVKHIWLIQSSTNNIFELFDNVDINVNAIVHTVIKKNVFWPIIDVYSPARKKGGLLNLTEIGYYDTQKNTYKVNSFGSKYWIRRNMTGVKFKADVVLPANYEGTLSDYLASDKNREINTFNRFHSRLMNFCRDYYNYTVDIRVEKSWGYKIDEKHFDGLVGDLEKRIIDFGYSPLFVRTDRATVMQYGRRTWILRAAFLFRNPKAKRSVEAYVKPLSWSIWICTLFSAFVAILTLKLSLEYERKKFNGHVDVSWSSLVLNTIGAFCQQGAMKSPTLLCGRIATIFIFLLTILIYQFYSASIVSNLLQKPQTLIKNLEQILLSAMRTGCEDILYNRDYFLYTTDTTSKRLYYEKILDTKRNTSNFLSPQEGLKMVEQGNYAFHVELATAYPIIKQTFNEKATCELREVQMYPTQQMHANVQKNSPFLDMVNFCLQRLAENGILHREINFWHPSKPECIQSSKSVIFKVGLEDFYPALLSLAMGILISFFELTVEIFIKIRLNARNTGSKKLYPFTN